MATPYSLIVLEDTFSTQDDAAAAYSGEPVLVVAARQLAGRGRAGSTWMSAPRALACSLAFRPSWPDWGVVPLVAGLAARTALPVAVSLKWPNDLVIAELGSPTGFSKVGGILSESDGARIVVGVGVNLWWPTGPAAALYGEDPGPSLALAIAERFASDLLGRLSAPPGEWRREEYVAACSLLGTEITWEPGGIGRAIDVDDDGALVVASAGAVLRLTSGEVRQVRPVSPDR